MKKLSKKILITTLFFALCLISISSVNADVHMNSTNNTIANATENGTNSGDTIYLDKGTYNSTHLNGTNGININKNLRIVGQGADKTIITADKNGRIFNITNTGTLTLINLTLINGFINGDGGAINNNGQLTITNCIMSNNTANNSNFGGVIHNTGNVNIYDSNFTNNTGFNGGAINNNGTFKINNSNFEDNNGSFGGAIYNINNIEINNSNFTNNRALMGGAIQNSGSDSNLTINNSNFNKNQANIENEFGGYGGAIGNHNGNVKIFNSYFNQNKADSDGGSIWNNCIETGNMAIINSTYINNTATNCGGAIYTSESINMNVSNSSFIDNKATYGGAIYNNFALNTNVTNSNFTNNDAEYGGAVYNDGLMFISKSNFINNNALSHGGGIYNDARIFVSQNMMSGNDAALGKTIYNNKDIGVLNLTYLDNSTIIVNNNTYILLYAVLTDDMGNPITGQNISFYVNGTFIGNQTATEGLANISFTVHHGKGEVVVTGDYVGSITFSNIVLDGQLLIVDNTEVNSTINLDKEEYWVNETAKGIITIFNNGSDIALNVTVKLNLQAKFTLDNNNVVVSHGYYDYNTNTWHIGNLNVNEEATMNFTGKFTKAGTYAVDIITSGENFNTTTDIDTALVKQNTTPTPEPNNNSTNNTTNNPTASASMKTTGIPINLLLIVLLSVLTVLIGKREN